MEEFDPGWASRCPCPRRVCWLVCPYGITHPLAYALHRLLFFAFFALFRLPTSFLCAFSAHPTFSWKSLKITVDDNFSTRRDSFRLNLLAGNTIYRFIP